MNKSMENFGRVAVASAIAVGLAGCGSKEKEVKEAVQATVKAQEKFESEVEAAVSTRTAELGIAEQGEGEVFTPTPRTRLETEEVSGPSVEQIFKAEESLNYPEIIKPNPSQQVVFPNVEHNGKEPLVEYGESFESGDYFQTGEGDIDLPQYHYRVMTAGEVNIEGLGVECEGNENTGCLVILVNHFGETAMFRDAKVDNGFTVAGRVWDMSTPEKVTEASQALLNHYTGRMIESDNQGANCGTIDGCEKINWHVVVVGNGQKQAHWAGFYKR
jgi:hypothetical protein